MMSKQSSRGLVTNYMVINDVGEIHHEPLSLTAMYFGKENLNKRIYPNITTKIQDCAEFDPFSTNCFRLFIPTIPCEKLYNESLSIFLNDTKFISIYRLNIKNILKEITTIHFIGGVKDAIKISKNKYEQTKRRRKNGLSGDGCFRSFWSKFQ